MRRCPISSHLSSGWSYKPLPVCVAQVLIARFLIFCSIPMTNRGEVTNSLPAFYLATSAGATSSGIRSNNGMSMGPSPYMVQNEHHHQSLGPAFSLQPYAAYPHGVIYQPVMVPPMLFQPGLGMMMSPSPSMTQPQSSRHRPFLHQNVISINNVTIATCLGRN